LTITEGFGGEDEELPGYYNNARSEIFMNKKVNVLYFSATETTSKVVKAVVEGISSIVKEHNITLPNNRNQGITFDENDLIIVGVPVYKGRVPVFLTDYFARVKGNNTAAVFVVVYGNRDYDDALIELKDTFEGNGFIGFAGGAFIGEHSYAKKVGTDRPDANDLKTAHEFGLRVKEKIEMYEDIAKSPQLSVRGNFPYKEIKEMPPMIPETNDQCTSCAVCAEHCPMGAISFDDFSEIDEAKCINCSSCVKRCPAGAKSITGEFFEKISQNLINNFGAVRREPELFI